MKSLPTIVVIVSATLCACGNSTQSGTAGAGGTGTAGTSAGGTSSGGSGNRAGETGSGGTSGSTAAVTGSNGHLAISDQGGCAITPSGDLSCWGFLADSAPAPGTATFASVSVFYEDEYVCALDTAGQATCWSGLSAENIPLAGPFLQVSCGSTYVCAIQSADGTVGCWAKPNTDPSPVLEPPTDRFTTISTGKFDACGVRSSGTLACWGEDVLGALTAPTSSFARVGSGEFYSCAGGPSGNACWGGASPASPATDQLIALAVAKQYACGIRQDGTLVCWGDVPAAHPDGSFREIALATGHGCAVKIDGTLACWGSLSASQVPPDGLIVE